MDETEIENRRMALCRATDLVMAGSQTIDDVLTTAEAMLAFLSGPKTQEA